jgi:drug/metabolite transporter (DMT)-like permease
VPVFLLAAGVVMFLMRPLFPHPQLWTTRTLYELGYVALLPALLAYAFWDSAMRRGDLVLVASVAYLAPVLSTICTSLYLHVTPGASLWIACGLVVAGAVVCRLSVTDPPVEKAADDAKPTAEA